ncbi:MAG: ABC transporter permease [Chlamydiota bacterium]
MKQRIENIGAKKEPKPNGRFKLSLEDITDSYKNWKVWLLLGWHDVRLRYRRSTLGPFWITATMVVLICSLGTVYSFLFKAAIADYFPYLACGILLWNFLMTTTMEFVDTFVEGAHFIKQIKLPYTLYVLRTLSRNLIVFFHNFLAVLPILIFYQIPVRPVSILIGLTLLSMIGFSFGTALAMLGSRYRDIKQLMQSVLQLIFYLTPIMWLPSMLPERFQILIRLNPIQQMIELVRIPLLGNSPSPYIFIYCLGVLISGIALMLFLLTKSRHRIAFWV